MIVTDDFPKPVITLQPMSQIALKDGTLNLTCQAVTSSDSTLNISWKKDHAVSLFLDQHIFLFLFQKQYNSPSHLALSQLLFKLA